MVQVNLHVAEMHLSQPVDRVAAGEEITITKAGKPLARLVAVEPRPRRQLGTLAGKAWLADDWDPPEVNEEIARDFYESDDDWPFRSDR